MQYHETLTQNSAEIFKKIADSSALSGRSSESVRLIWVSKNMPFEAVQAAHALGASDFGENRIQEALEKFVPPLGGAALHIIGPVQKNKMRKAVQVADWIHSVSSHDDLARLSTICVEENKIMRILFQVNTSGEDTKNGIPKESAAKFLNAVPLLPNLLYCGLMTIGKNSDNPEECRSEFRFLKELRDTFFESDERFLHFKELSMGMSHDMHIAIEEGATMIRIGTALFGERRKEKE